jgi:hypothetical protein
MPSEGEQEMGEGFEVVGPGGSPVELHANVSDRERRRYVGQLRAVSQAAELAADGFEENNDPKALAGTIGVAMMWDQIGSELREVIEEALETSAREFASRIDIDPDTVVIPDTVDEVIAGFDNEEEV